MRREEAGLTELSQSWQLLQVQHVAKVFHRDDSISVHISRPNNHIDFIVGELPVAVGREHLSELFWSDATFAVDIIGLTQIRRAASGYGAI